jgi:hypothetical protein
MNKMLLLSWLLFLNAQAQDKNKKESILLAPSAGVGLNVNNIGNSPTQVGIGLYAEHIDFNIKGKDEDDGHLRLTGNLLFKGLYITSDNKFQADRTNKVSILASYNFTERLAAKIDISNVNSNAKWSIAGLDIKIVNKDNLKILFNAGIGAAKTSGKEFYLYSGDKLIGNVTVTEDNDGFQMGTIKEKKSLAAGNNVVEQITPELNTHFAGSIGFDMYLQNKNNDVFALKAQMLIPTKSGKVLNIKVDYTKSLTPWLILKASVQGSYLKQDSEIVTAVNEAILNNSKLKFAPNTGAVLPNGSFNFTLGLGVLLQSLLNN